MILAACSLHDAAFPRSLRRSVVVVDWCPNTATSVRRPRKSSCKSSPERLNLNFCVKLILHTDFPTSFRRHRTVSGWVFSGTARLHEIFWDQPSSHHHWITGRQLLRHLQRSHKLQNATTETTNQTKPKQHPNMMIIQNTNDLPSLAISNDFLSKYQVTTVPSAGVVAALAASSDEYQPLPADYKPSKFDCVMGRGKGSYNQPGNKRMRQIIKEAIPEYKAAKSKYDKSAVLHSIVHRVKEQDNGIAMFVTRRKGQWCEVPEDRAREKVGHCMRETIALVDESAMEKKQKKQQHFDNKQDDLLERQRATFDNLLSSTLMMSNSTNAMSFFATTMEEDERQEQQPEEQDFVLFDDINTTFDV